MERELHFLTFKYIIRLYIVLLVYQIKVEEVLLLFQYFRNINN